MQAITIPLMYVLFFTGVNLAPENAKTITVDGPAITETWSREGKQWVAKSTGKPWSVEDRAVAGMMGESARRHMINPSMLNLSSHDWKKGAVFFTERGAEIEKVGDTFRFSTSTRTPKSKAVQSYSIKFE